MTLDDLRVLFARDLDGMKRQILDHPDDDSVWDRPEGISNPAGNLAFHVAGNLQHFIGAVLGDTGYRRDRDAEFANRAGSRAEIASELDRTAKVVDATLARLDKSSLDRPYPEPLGGVSMSTRRCLAHLAMHLAYHLGQVDVLRRTRTGRGAVPGMMSVRKLANPDQS
jgi:uncharacterized damage-inducible protein DinB